MSHRRRDDLVHIGKLALEDLPLKRGIPRRKRRAGIEHRFAECGVPVVVEIVHLGPTSRRPERPIPEGVGQRQAPPPESEFEGRCRTARRKDSRTVYPRPGKNRARRNSESPRGRSDPAAKRP